MIKLLKPALSLCALFAAPVSIAHAQDEKRMVTEAPAQASEPGPVVTTASGLQIQVLAEGAGASPAQTDIVLIGYKGMLKNGTVFDQNTAAPLPVNGVVPGFAEALQLMKKGGRYKIWIPSALGYGDQAIPDPQTGKPIIPAGSTLIFEIEMIDFKDRATYIKELSEAQNQQIPVDEASERARAMRGAENAVYLAGVQAKEGAEKLETGLLFKTIKAGKGNYRVLRTDNSVFDQGKSASISVGGRLGLSDAFLKMQKGGKYKVWVPDGIRNGNRKIEDPNTGKLILESYSILIYEVELLSFTGTMIKTTDNPNYKDPKPQ
jgi:FKBP-type peptidyl-prolyl cis-trans isomerase FkpA